MSLRTRLLTGIVLVNLAAFSVLAAALVRDVERRRAARAQDEAEIRDTYVGVVRELFVAFFAQLDFSRLDLKSLLGARYWEHVRDAYITDFVFRVGEGIVSGDMALNPVGAFGADALRRRSRGLELMVRAYENSRVEPEGDVVAIPLYSGLGAERYKWGAAWVQVAVPSLPRPPAGMGLTFLAFALGGATVVAMGLVFLLMHFLVLEPLGRISEGAQRVRRGIYSLAVRPTGRGDEIDELVVSFNAMMGEIGQSREALERRVDDMVARMRLAEQRLVLTDRLAAMGTLAAGIAHEINNPLGGMLNAVRSLRRQGGVPAAHARYLDLVADGLGRIRDVVQRVLRFSPRQRARRAVTLLEVVGDAARFTSYQLDRAGVGLDVEVDPELRVVADAAALGQVFLNLILNGVHAMAGRTGRIVVAAERVERSESGPSGATRDVLIRVTDQGRGMSDEEQRRAFDLFYTTREAGAGTGLGLSIAHQIITDHGGTIRLESRPGKGTGVFIQLPEAPSGSESP